MNKKNDRVRIESYLKMAGDVMACEAITSHNLQNSRRHRLIDS